MSDTVYMIRRKSDGLFSSGGATPTFSKVGKMWRNLNTFHNHLSMFKYRYLPWGWRNKQYDDGPYENGVFILPDQYRGCEVVTIKIAIDKATDLQEYIKKERKSDKLRKAQ